jgi:hypothetical protein
MKKNEIKERLAHLINETSQHNLVVLNASTKNEGNSYSSDLANLTATRHEVIGRSFYHIAFADYLPVVIGDNGLNDSLLLLKNSAPLGNFEEAISKADRADGLYETPSSFEKNNVPIFLWAAKARYSLFEMERSLQHDNWDMVEERHKNRKQMWDLGLQKVAFVGLKGQTGATGLINNGNVQVNSTLITKNLSSMNESELNSFCRNVLLAYRMGERSLVWPNTFLIPLTDWIGLSALVGANANGCSKLDIMLKAFRQITANPLFKIDGLPYLDSENNEEIGLGKNRYVLYNNNIDVLHLNITHDFTTTSQSSANNFEFEDVAYGAFSAVCVTKAAELLYLDKTESTGASK